MLSLGSLCGRRRRRSCCSPASSSCATGGNWSSGLTAACWRSASRPIASPPLPLPPDGSGHWNWSRWGRRRCCGSGPERVSSTISVPAGAMRWRGWFFPSWAPSNSSRGGRGWRRCIRRSPWRSSAPALLIAGGLRRSGGAPPAAAAAAGGRDHRLFVCLARPQYLARTGRWRVSVGSSKSGF